MKAKLNNLIFGGVALIVGTVLFFIMFDIVRIKGNETGVKEVWNGGVVNDPLPPGTYIIPAWQSVRTYNVGFNVYSMAKENAYLVQSSDSQDMHFSLQVQWRIDPLHVVNLHKTAGSVANIETVFIQPVLLKVVKNKATVQKAIDVYAGEGLVKLQLEIEKELSAPTGELAQNGVIVTNFVIEHNKLDPEYVKEITARQVAIVRELRAVQEEKAAQAVALVAKATAQADLNKAVVEAQRDKEVAVLAAEAKSETVILEAKGKKEQVVLAAEAEKESGELKAASIVAIGKATAEAETLKFTAFSAPGAETYAKIEIAKSMSAAFGNIKGYLPESMNIYTLGESFTKAVENIVKPAKN